MTMVGYVFNPSPNDKIPDSSERVCIQQFLNLIKNNRKFSIREENIVGKEKLLVARNFSISHHVFKRLVLQTWE